MSKIGIPRPPLASRADLPLVSCIPAYNAARFIRETLESALVLDYPNLEISINLLLPLYLGIWL
jgi:cellulose synthase/poly-beta-1,6-N-acetylglucosamine synthase-like glycosyltransferase